MTTSSHDAPLPLLGGLTPREFLRRHWQKKPLLVRGALRDFTEPLTRAEVLELATREEAESRVVCGSGRDWTLEHGPFAKRAFTDLRRRAAPWTVLVQDTQHFSHEAHDLLSHFHFISSARIDDLMVSYAVDGGGVGPHVDSYDVFLLQGSGRRRWRISEQADLALVDGLPLKILRRFRAEREFVLEKGDLLYLPPQVAHHGIADGECLTWSVGFRAPANQELVNAYLDFLRDEWRCDGQYADPGARPASQPALAGPAMERGLREPLRSLVKGAGSVTLMNRAMGRFLTEPKAHVFFEAPHRGLSPREFARVVARRGVRLALATRLLSFGGAWYVNGRELATAAADEDLWRELGARRRLDGGRLAGRAASFLAALHRLHADGALDIIETSEGG